MKSVHYLSEEWNNKRIKILARDNYTCQNCLTFNPSLGCVEINNPDDSSLELHNYESNPGSSVYNISSTKTRLTINIDFGTDWLVMPTLQVHHLRYIENRPDWDYDDNDLITLCKDCHTFVHKNLEISLYDSNGYLVQKKKYSPENYDSGHRHDYKPWTFIHLNNQNEYESPSTIQPSLTIFLLEKERERSDEIKEIATVMYKNFFKKYLPNYIK